MPTGILAGHETARAEWADRNPRVAGALSAMVTGALLADFAHDLVEHPTLEKATATAALGVLFVAEAVETVRPNTFRLWERFGFDTTPH